MKNKLSQLQSCVGGYTVSNDNEYTMHLRNIEHSLNVESSQYPYLIWMYAVELYEVVHDIPSALPSIISKIPQS